MSGSMNKVIICGNLGQDPELRTTAGGAKVATLSVATTEYMKGQDGQKKEMTEWHRVILWNAAAENAAKYLAKGRSVLVEGRLQTRSWEDKQGQKRYTTEIIGNNIQFLGSAQNQNQNQNHGYQPPASQNNYNTQSDMGAGMSDWGSPNTPGIDDIPF